MNTSTITAVIQDDIGTEGQLRALADVIPAFKNDVDTKKRVHTMFHKNLNAPEAKAVSGLVDKIVSADVLRYSTNGEKFVQLEVVVAKDVRNHTKDAVKAFLKDITQSNFVVFC